ncbi:hypothetical protein D9619_009267 [Psilocybe cf. subviscida]|uniref:ER membrane protein complex subunit 1 n=1 Tax=Psilocybe cf. subviscida TaxID=2480587 RepID=A0A8H5FAD4_9AGAR|nr:hypothetical protein D9619_009267 [Psilocybe cf. subviscida]
MRLPSLLRLGLAVLPFLSLPTPTWALHAADAGIVDWHKHLVGAPMTGAAVTAPSFYRTIDEDTGTEESTILTATGNNVLAALKAADGSVRWRYIFEKEDRILGYWKGETAIVSLSGPGGAVLRAFHPLSGDLLVESPIHDPAEAILAEPAWFGKDVAFSVDSNPSSSEGENTAEKSEEKTEFAYVLTNGRAVRKVNLATGATMWTWESADQGSSTIQSRLAITPDALYVVAVVQSTASYTLHVTTLHPSTGALLREQHIQSSLLNPLVQFAVLTASSRPTGAVKAPTTAAAVPVVAWLESGTLRHLTLTPALSEKPRLMPGLGFERVVDVGADVYARGECVLVKTDGSSSLVRISVDGETARVKAGVVWEYAESAHSKESPGESSYAGGVDKEGNAYVGRVWWKGSEEKASTDVFAGHLVEGAGLASGFLFPFDTKQHGIISHVALDAWNPSAWTVHARLLVSTSTGSIQLWEQTGTEAGCTLRWIREEALAGVVVAQIVELPPAKAGALLTSENDNVNGTEVARGFFSQLVWEVATASSLPSFLWAQISRAVALIQPPPKTTAPSRSPAGPLARDQFGFRQVIVAATVFGKLYGIDSANGDIVWSRVLGLGWAGQVGGRVQPVKLFTVKAVGDVDPALREGDAARGGQDPEVVLVGQRRADNTLVDTVVFHFNALTGADVTGRAKDEEVFEGHDLIQGPLIEGFLLGGAGEPKVAVLLDEYLQVYLYPDNDATQALFTALAPSLSFPVRTTVEGQQRVVGHAIDLSTTVHKSLAYPTWSLTLPAGTAVQAMTPQARSTPASYGRVLGNRTTLYKYLNARAFLLTTANAPLGTCGLRVVDGAKGTVLYTTEVKATPGKGCDIKAHLVENWLVYHYYEGEVGGGTAADSTGYRMVTVEFYEGTQPDEKTESSGLSSFSDDALNFQTLEQAYVFPYAITALATTSTKYGISTKDLIVATANHRIQSFPRRVLDPRRPNRKVTAEEAEEFMSTYEPLLPNDPRRVLSHNYDVANTQTILTAPALLESTSLVFAFGLDMFLTRVSPSNTFDVLSESFNKVQLVLTVTGLLVAILITRPMVERKQLKAKWY